MNNNKAAHSFLKNPEKLKKLNYLIQNSKSSEPRDLSKNLSLSLSISEKPVNLLFSLDQFFFEFSKKTYQQKKIGEFFQQLKERKKLSLFYGHLTRKTLVILLRLAKKQKGSFSRNLLCLLERRLDVVIYRSGMSQTIAEARQLIRHKKIRVNENWVTIPSFLVSFGDIISISTKIGDSLNNRLLKFQENKLIKNHSTISGDFYSKFKKTLLQKNASHKITNQLISLNFQSKILCKILIKLLCNRIKLRSFLILTGKTETLLKWKNFSSTRDLITKGKKDSSYSKNLFYKKEKNNSVRLTHKLKDNLNDLSTGGLFIKNFTFWNLDWMGDRQKKILFSKNFKNSHEKKSKKSMNSSFFKEKGNKQKNLALYRTSFLLFLKYLENHKKFSTLIGLNLKKFLFTENVYKSKSTLKKTLNFRQVKPMHLEMSYKISHVIYLYSPQRLNFPFFIDLDIISRSLI